MKVKITKIETETEAEFDKLIDILNYGLHYMRSNNFNMKQYEDIVSFLEENNLIY